ncbi:MAG: right-handed parallel beta-helix repeat-containing protein [Holophagales bacterium]|nr:right-handed parallel beta-helix repeat-containing protein [Holophagales bacterium]
MPRPSHCAGPAAPCAGRRLLRRPFLSSVAALLVSVSASLIATAPAAGTIFEIGPGDDLQAAIDALSPGDVLELRDGTYIVTSRLSVRLQCTAALPCVIRAKRGHAPHVHRPNAGENLVDIEFSRYVTLHGIEWSGGSRGVRIRESSFVTVEECHIHGTAGNALSANDPGSAYEGIRLLRNHIHDTGGAGEGMYLGCNFNGCQFFGGLIEGNYIHHTNGPTVTQGDGIEIKEGSWGNVVRDNVIHDTGFPCILTYSTVGNGGPNLIEGNLMWGCGDHGIQSAADAVIRNNLILGSDADGIACQPHQAGTPDHLEILHNTVLAPTGHAVRLSGVTGSVVLAGNALYAQTGDAVRASGDLGAVSATGNVGAGTLQGLAGGFDPSGDLGTDFVAASYSGSLPQDLFPAPGSILVGAADPAWVPADDFNRTPRESTADAGAYRYAATGNPGWTLAAGFKPPAAIFADGFESATLGTWSSAVP